MTLYTGSIRTTKSTVRFH